MICKMLNPQQIKLLIFVHDRLDHEHNMCPKYTILRYTEFNMVRLLIIKFMNLYVKL